MQSGSLEVLHNWSFGLFDQYLHIFSYSQFLATTILFASMSLIFRFLTHVCLHSICPSESDLFDLA